ncbi:cytochrome P450, partial [Streptomyces clavuligerus]
MTKHTARTPAATSAEPIPEAPGAFPLIGHALAMTRDPIRFVTSLPRHGAVVKMRFGPAETLMICDPELTRRMFLDARTFDKGGYLFDRAREVIGENLITCPHSAHQRARRLTQPAFHPTRLRGYTSIMSEVIAESAHSWPTDRPFDPVGPLLRLTAQVTARAMFSQGLSGATLDRFVTDIVTTIDGIYLRSLVPRSLDWLPLPAHVRHWRARPRLDAIYRDIIRTYRAEPGDRGDLLSMLLATQEDREITEGAPPLSDAEIKDQLSGFFAAGTETTASTLAWALHVLAERQDLQERLRTEVDTVLGGRPAGYDDIERLEQTRRILTEVLRVHSPIFFITRSVMNDTRLGPHLIPAGSIVAYSPYLVHGDPQLHDRPDVFDPDRWAPGNAPPRHGFIPFASGPRK